MCCASPSHGVSHRHARTHVYRIDISKRWSDSTLVAGVQSARTELLLKMRSKTVGHGHLMSPRQRFDQWVDLRCSGFPGVICMRTMGLLASIKLARVQLTKLLLDATDGDVVVVDHNGRRGASALVRTTLSINMLVSQEHALPLVRSQTPGRVRSLSDGFKWADKPSSSGRRCRSVLWRRWRAANEAFLVRLGLRCAWR